MNNTNQINDVITKNAIILSNICENVSVEEAYDAIKTMIKIFETSK